MNILTVQGIGGSGAEHWQTRWARQHRQVRAQFRPSSWDAPDPDDWQAALGVALDELGPRTLVVAHSLGCLAVAEYAARHGNFVGAVLVAPPDTSSAAFPAAAAAFAGRASAPMTVPALVLASSDDVYCSPDTAQRLARSWGAELMDTGPYGHLNGSRGLGDWQWGWDVVQGFATRLDELPGDAEAAS